MRVRLKHVARLVSGGTPSVDNETFWADGDDGTPWVTIGDMSAERVVVATARRLSDAGVAAARLTLAPAGTVLYSIYASVGLVARLGAPATWNQAILGVVPRNGVSGDYLAYALASLRPSLGLHLRSNTQHNLNADVVGNFELVVPSETEQIWIAEFLDTETARIDALVGARTRQRELLAERHAASVARAMATAGPRVRLASAIVSIEQGASPQCADRPAGPGESGVLKLSAVSGRGFSPSENKLLAGATNSDRVVVRDGDLLVTRANTPMLVGLAAVARLGNGDSTLLLPDLIYRLTLREGHDADYVQLALSTADARGQMTSAARGSSQSMVKLRGEDLRELRVPLPALERQRSIASGVGGRRAGVDRALAAIDRQIALLRERRQALITAAVTGKLQVPTAATANAAA